MKPIDADYRQIMLLPPSLEDLVGPEHPARYIREFVDSLRTRDLGLEQAQDPLGRPAYSEWLLLKIWLLAYAMRLRSSREVEAACRDHMGMLWIAGMLRPDHNTLWRFWHKHRGLVKRLFRESVRVAYELGMVEFALHAVDGTKIQAAGSTSRATKHKDLERLLTRLDEQVESLEVAIRASGSEGGDTLGELSSKLQDRKTLRDKIAAALQVIPDDALQRHPGEPEARVMKGCGLGYNAQTVVDAKAEIIVATALVNDQNDTGMLVPMLEQVEQEWGKVAEQTVADSGYNTGEALAQSEEKGYPVILAKSSAEVRTADDPYAILQFRYDADQDVVICPQGSTLTFRGEVRSRVPALRRYRSTACGTCPVRDQCTDDKRGRTIDLSLPHLHANERQRLKRAVPQNMALLKRRMAIAERPFASIKHRFGFRRFHAKTRAGAEIEWFFACLLHNTMRIISANPLAFR
jgi:transposase